MTSWTRALLLAVAIVAAVAMPGVAAERRRPVCLSEGESRDAVAARRTIPPFRAVEAALRVDVGELMSIRLCRDEAAMVYDVGVLNRDGRLVHILVDAGSGAVVPGHTGP
jgi:uncharacterized membrane protein YkoI